MKYLCLIYVEEKNMENVSQSEMDAVVDECRVHDRALRDKGQLIASERLQPVSTATTLRINGSKTSIVDGPFAETKEQLGGFYLVNAENLDEAMKIATSLPPARFGCVELRPVWEYG